MKKLFFNFILVIIMFFCKIYIYMFCLFNFCVRVFMCAPSSRVADCSAARRLLWESHVNFKWHFSLQLQRIPQSWRCSGSHKSGPKGPSSVSEPSSSDGSDTRLCSDAGSEMASSEACEACAIILSKILSNNSYA